MGFEKSLAGAMGHLIRNCPSSFAMGGQSGPCTITDRQDRATERGLGGRRKTVSARVLISKADFPKGPKDRAQVKLDGEKLRVSEYLPTAGGAGWEVELVEASVS